MKNFAIATSLGVVCVLFFFAIIGALWMYNLKPQPVTYDTCDDIISYEDGSVVCEIRMQGANDDIQVVRR